VAAISQVAAPSTIENIGAVRGLAAKTPVFLTFDDGALSAYSVVADALEQYGWRGHFFIVTDWIGRAGYLDRHHIRELSQRGHVIGTHTRSHPERMSCLTWTELTREWSESRAVLSDVLGRPVKVGSVANGFYSAPVGKAAIETGIEVLFTSTPTTRVHAEGGGIILGRFSMQRRTPPTIAAAIAANDVVPRFRQAVSWYTKGIVKSVAGEEYFRIRRLIISGMMPRRM
jgi:peptidoglycan/xylan/chitin deacetylase (PgdA/CDA1 family)